ncbi:two-component system, chemotaxis family, response regulator CheY [Ectothiorhodospira magna]|uniref:Two-component system, chemotaxis family, response regulator CheY n=1 Tax=Ectothiorhodospira magna TaxID=867345 RepID=A0A1H9E7T4_9GAMM|nr:response regulator [Ectothiorhodospira magna]SEQ21697.1 two-component system, chemotaxis family, response regulator CheY [Ectothiorhodospira magna]
MSQRVCVEDLAILLIEPSRTQRQIITKLLSDGQIQKIETADSAAAALNIMAGYVPDLLISNFYMPDMEAPELFARMSADPNLSEVPKMVISSEQDHDKLDAVRQSGVLALLPKPFDRCDLERALRVTLDYLEEEELDLEDRDITEVRVLLVDDSRMARNHLRRVLEHVGAQHIDEVENGALALEQLSQHEYDLVVTDYNMPVMDGQALVNEIRSNPAYVHIPVMMVTSESDISRLSSVKQAGVSAICDKPFEVNQVRKLLKRII